jgi:hypothetical protein
MLLLGVREENGWLMSTFNLTYPAGLDEICKAVSKTYGYYDDVEILVDDKKINISSKDEILKLEEAGNMTIRGMSKIIKAPIMITFFNQTKTVNVAVPCMAGEFEKADYQKFNMSLGEYMDSIELAMYR